MVKLYESGRSIANRVASCYKRGVDKTIRKYGSFDEMKADEYRYWQSRPGHERMDAVAEIILASYAMKGVTPDVSRLQRTLVRLQRPQS
jgi:hypothetical protein